MQARSSGCCSLEAVKLSLSTNMLVHRTSHNTRISMERLTRRRPRNAPQAVQTGLVLQCGEALPYAAHGPPVFPSPQLAHGMTKARATQGRAGASSTQLRQTSPSLPVAPALFPQHTPHYTSPHLPYSLRTAHATAIVRLSASFLALRFITELTRATTTTTMADTEIKEGDKGMRIFHLASDMTEARDSRDLPANSAR